MALRRPSSNELQKRVEAAEVTAAAAMSGVAATPEDVLEDFRRARGTGAAAAQEADLANAIVSSLCFANNTPSGWKLLDRALSSRFLSPLRIFALLTQRLIPHRKTQPEAYRLYLELLSRYVPSLSSMELGPSGGELVKSVDEALQLSDKYGIQGSEIGQVVVFFYLDVVMRLIDSTLEDWNVLPTSMNRAMGGYAGEGPESMDIDGVGNARRNEHRDQLCRTNSQLAVVVVEKMTADKKAQIFLRQIHLNSPEKFNDLLQRLHYIDSLKSTSQNVISSSQAVSLILSNVQKVMEFECRLEKHQLVSVIFDAGSFDSVHRYSPRAGRTHCWIPLDSFMENVMDGRHLIAVSGIEIISELMKSLRVVNQACWKETFQAVWISALQLVQRHRESLEGPIPQLDARLCMLLSVVPLAISHVIGEETEMPPKNNVVPGAASVGYNMEVNKYESRRHGLISSLQFLGQFSELLVPHPSVMAAANNAATKAANYISNYKKGNDRLGGFSHNDAPVEAVGNMLHLVVEACISRKLIDTSAYLWPGYVMPRAPSQGPTLVHENHWSNFLGGAPLTVSLKHALMTTPASSLAELEKLHDMSLNGTEEEKSAAAKILCGASLVRGWNIQEHVVHIVVKLLSPHLPSESPETENCLIAHMPMLNALLLGLSCVDKVHIISLFGMIPEVAAALMPLCEAFGSLSPPSDYRSVSSDEPSTYSVFSCAFLFLLRLWKFYRPPQEHTIAGRAGNVKLQLTLDYLLLLRNNYNVVRDSTPSDGANEVSVPVDASSGQPVYIDSFRKLRAWYMQNQACIASTLSGMCNKNPVHLVANKILNMICRKMSKSGTASGNPSSSSCSVSGSNSGEETPLRPLLPAWEVLEAIPFVLEAVLTACAHGRLSSRELTTGLRDLVEYLPASLATIVTYFSAEITRGIWKPVPMNGSEWPSPAANLALVASEINQVLQFAGVHVSSYNACGSATIMLPLPMAALVSLTITFKIDKSLEYIHGIVGQALEHCSTGFSWPSMPVIAALWTQKARRWHDFIILSCARSPFTRDKEAVIQLIRSCFSSFLGTLQGSGTDIMATRGVSGLLGPAIADHGSIKKVAPGFLYLRSCRLFHDTHFVSNVILQMVIEWAQDPNSAGRECKGGSVAKLKSSQNSLASAAVRSKEVALLGATLVCSAGGLQLVQVLYEETLPTYLLSPRDAKASGGSTTASHILEGYTMAYLLVLSGGIMWGMGKTSLAYASIFTSKRKRSIGIHMDFVASVSDGKVSLGCDLITWKAYVSCLICLLVSNAPSWVPELKMETLQKLAGVLRRWGKPDLALALLERGGPGAVTAVVETVILAS